MLKHVAVYWREYKQPSSPKISLWKLSKRNSQRALRELHTDVQGSHSTCVSNFNGLETGLIVDLNHPLVYMKRDWRVSSFT